MLGTPNRPKILLLAVLQKSAAVKLKVGLLFK